jgi:hypothetical protein
MKNLAARITPAEAQASLEGLPEPYRVFLELGHGTLGWYAPQGIDDQTPHLRDELYIVATGTAQFRRAEEVVACAPGDLLTVAAGIEHRFEEMSPDFGVWVVFYGPARSR